MAMQGSASFSLPDEVKQAVRDLRLKRRFRWLSFGVDDETREFFIDAAEGDKQKNVKDLCNDLPIADARYVLLDHEYQTADKRDTGKIYFICWNPSAASTQTQMLYMHALPVLRSICDGCFDLNVSDGRELQEEIVRDTKVGTVDDDYEEDENWMDA